LQSITTAAKRQSMQIADNLGIIVKQGDAYKKYADSIGVSVTALTNEQKQVAFLNGLLEAGNVLIEQAGGTTESAADGYAQLTTNVTNLTDELKANAATGLGPFVQSLVDGMKAVRAFNEAFPEFKGNAQQRAFAIAEFTKQQELSNNAVQVGAMTEQEYFDKLLNTAEAQKGLTPSMIAYTTTQSDVTVAVGASAQAIGTFREAMGGAISNEMIAFRDRESELIVTGEELRAKISELEAKRYLTAAQKQELADLKTALGDNTAAVEENALKHEEATRRIVFGFVEQRLAMDGLTTEELGFLQKLATEWGLMDKAVYTNIGTVDILSKAVEDGVISWEAYMIAVKNTQRALEDIPTEIGITIRYTDVGYKPGGGQYTAYQHGGTTPGGAFLAGERGPEMITGVPGGARVLSAPTTARMMAQQSVTNNFNLTTQSMLRSGGLALEFATMEMGSR